MYGTKRVSLKRSSFETYDFVLEWCHVWGRCSGPDVGEKFCNSGVAKTSNYTLTDPVLPSAAGPVGHGSLKPSNPLPLITIENGDRQSWLNLSNAIGTEFKSRQNFLWTPQGVDRLKKDLSYVRVDRFVAFFVLKLDRFEEQILAKLSCFIT